VKKPTKAAALWPAGKVLRLPVWVLLLRLVPLAGGLALALTVRHWAALVGAALLGLSALAGVLAWLRFRVEYDRDGLRVRSVSLANRRCAYADLWGIEGSKRLYLDKGSVRLYRGEAWDDLVKTAQRGYQRSHGKRISRVFSVRRSWDPFNGNINNWKQILFVYAILYLMLIGALIFALVERRILQAASLNVAVWILVGLLILHTAFVSFSIYVGRNADVLPFWVVTLCFRPSSLSFRKD
jgi:hypothetical protein